MTTPTYLNQETLITSFNYHSPSSHGGNGSVPFKMEVPASSVSVVKPLTYEFRVTEHVDDAGVITKVGLQVQVWEHSHFGTSILKQDWVDVPRVRLTPNQVM